MITMPTNKRPTPRTAAKRRPLAAADEAGDDENEDLPSICDPDSDEYDEDECRRKYGERYLGAEEAGDDNRYHDTRPLFLDASSIRMTNDGYMVASARVARTGI